MKTGENITTAMIPEFELSAEMEQQATIWAALDGIDRGATPDEILLVYGLTSAQLDPHRAAWRLKHPLPAHA